MALLPTLQELGIGFVLFSPLGAGFLTGKSVADLVVKLAISPRMEARQSLGVNKR